LLRELRELLNEQLECLFGIISMKGTIILCSDVSQEGKDFEKFDELVKNTKDKPAIDGLIFASFTPAKVS